MACNRLMVARTLVCKSLCVWGGVGTREKVEFGVGEGEGEKRGWCVGVGVRAIAHSRQTHFQ